MSIRSYRSCYRDHVGLYDGPYVPDPDQSSTEASNKVGGYKMQLLIEYFLLAHEYFILDNIYYKLFETLITPLQ